MFGVVLKVIGSKVDATWTQSECKVGFKPFLAKKPWTNPFGLKSKLHIC